MKKLKTVVTVLFFVWLFAVQAFAAVVPFPRLAVIQREKTTELIFSWPSAVSFSEKQDGRQYEVVFKSSSVPDTAGLDSVLPALPSELKQMSLSAEGNDLKFSVRLPPGYSAGAKASGVQVFVALSESGAEEKKAPAPAPAPAKETPKPVVQSPPAEQKPAAPVDVPTGPLIDDTPEKTEPMPQIDVASVVPYAPGQTDVSLSLSSPKIFSKDKNPQDDKIITLASGYRSATLSFPWTRMTAVATFRRDGYLWIVFDRRGDFDFSLEREIYKDIIHEMIQVPHSHATIFRLVTEKGYNPSLRREGLMWIVDLMYQPLRPRQPIDLILQRKTPFGPRIFIPLDEAPQVLPLIDPEVGDLMYIVPVFAYGKGVPNQRSFVDVTFLPTAQGVVIEPTAEGVNVFASTSGLEVRGPKGGMRFSSEDILSFLAKTKAGSDPLTQTFDVSVWLLNDQNNYLQILKKLQNDVLEAPRGKKDVPRLILSRYYFANGLYPEAMSVLRVLVADNPDMDGHPSIIALRGAINFMMMRYAEAMQDLASPQMKDNDAAEFWRAATLAATSRTPDQYLMPMKENMAILQSYPQPVKTRLALAGLHAAVAGGDEFSIQNFMEAAYNSQNSDAENDEITFYHALWQETTGMYSLARTEMTTLAEGNNFYFRAMGGLEKVRMDTRAGAMSPEERIRELERLSYAWRGGEFEYNLMTMLVAAYQDQKDFSQVLHILKNMKIRFAGMPESEKITQLMEEIFQKLYLSSDENVISPVTAIALYDEFSDLTPPGEKGAQIIRRLADRLVSIDLLDRAAELLDGQLRQPIGAKERGLVATRLALVRLLNKEPDKALAALKLSEKANFSDKIKKQRLYIQAKALADLKQPEKAAELLEQDDSQEAKMLRAEIFWQAQIWDKAADALKVLINRPKPDVPLTPQEAQRVLDWAAALRLAGRPKVVIRLRENFMPYMEKTDLAEAFDFITKSPQQGLMDYRTVAKEVESAESFHTFAKEYTNLLKTQGLSRTVQ